MIEAFAQALQTMSPGYSSAPTANPPRGLHNCSYECGCGAVFSRHDDSCDNGHCSARGSGDEHYGRSLQTLIDALDRWEIDPVTAVCLKILGIMSMTTGAVGTIPRSHLIRPVTFLNKWSLNMQYPTQVFTTTCNCREYDAMLVISRNAAITCVIHLAATPSFCGLVF